MKVFLTDCFIAPPNSVLPLVFFPFVNESSFLQIAQAKHLGNPLDSSVSFMSHTNSISKSSARPSTYKQRAAHPGTGGIAVAFFFSQFTTVCMWKYEPIPRSRVPQAEYGLIKRHEPIYRNKVSMEGMCLLKVYESLLIPQGGHRIKNGCKGNICGFAKGQNFSSVCSLHILRGVENKWNLLSTSRRVEEKISIWSTT